MSKLTKISVFMLVGFLLVPLSVSANYYTMPINVTLASTTAWFDHDTTSNEKYYDGDDGTLRSYDNHHGVDFSAPVGTDVLAAATGTVAVVGWQDPDEGVGYGFRVYLYHSDYDQRTVYAHLASTSVVSVNDIVGRSLRLGVSSSTGESSGPHLHFGVYDCDCTTSTEQVDPFGWQAITADPWPYNTNVYLWTTDPPSFLLASTAPGTVSTNDTWRGNYVTTGTTINSGVTLTLDPGTIIKFNGTTANLLANGILNARGTTANPIYLTSYKDDSVGGDTNGDGSATTPASGNWRALEVSSTGSTTLSNTVVRYGGNYNGWALYNNGGYLNISSSTVATSSTYGVYTSVGTTTVSGSELMHNYYGFFHAGGNSTISTSAIHNNTGYGVYNGTGSTINAENNFWGIAGGPNDSTNRNSGADYVYSDSNVDYDPWLNSW